MTLNCLAQHGATSMWCWVGNANGSYGMVMLPFKKQLMDTNPEGGG